MKRILDDTNFFGRLIFGILPDVNLDTFKPGDTTPNVSNRSLFKTLPGVVTITNFLGGAQGQSISIFGRSTITIANNSNIKTNTGADKILSDDMVFRFTQVDNVWYEDAN